LKLRNMKNLPVFSEGKAEVIGQVDKVVIGDDFKLAYIVIKTENSTSLIKAEDLEIGEEAIIINCPDKIKSYAYGEELSIYDKKLSDTIYDEQGREMGYVSDFILSRQSKQIWGIELCSGVIKDLLAGRQEIPLEQVHFKSDLTGMLRNGGNNENDH
jgi:uncharacterized protein YrrD